ncbi:MAG: metallophosphoesterase [Woeseiaceae bacterium]
MAAADSPGIALLIAVAMLFGRAASADTDASSAWSRPVVVVGDLQRTSILERVLLLRENNKSVQTRLIAMIKELQPGTTVIVGDLVYHPSSAGDWRRYEELTSGLGTIMPALGNHDYACFLGFWPCSNRTPGSSTALSLRCGQRQRAVGLCKTMAR